MSFLRHVPAQNVQSGHWCPRVSRLETVMHSLMRVNHRFNNFKVFKVGHCSSSKSIIYWLQIPVGLSSPKMQAPSIAPKVRGFFKKTHQYQATAWSGSCLIRQLPDQSGPGPWEVQYWPLKHTILRLWTRQNNTSWSYNISHKRRFKIIGYNNNNKGFIFSDNNKCTHPWNTS